jgi:hypothetical protein
LVKNTAIISYKGDASWVEGALMGIRELLNGKRRAPLNHSKDCELGLYLTDLTRYFV